uniref:Uncharacterized protein n=1 Tax=Panagrolaimus sp. ES5 TaxID=591445 RepID=A0AC34GMB6_9BILA
MFKQNLIFVAFLVLFICATASMASPPHILARRDDFNDLVSELRSKGSRMRFGKRSSASNFEPMPLTYFLAIPPTNADEI